MIDFRFNFRICLVATNGAFNVDRCDEIDVLEHGRSRIIRKFDNFWNQLRELSNLGLSGKFGNTDVAGQNEAVFADARVGGGGEDAAGTNVAVVFGGAGAVADLGAADEAAEAGKLANVSFGILSTWSGDFAGHVVVAIGPEVAWTVVGEAIVTMLVLDIIKDNQWVT